MITPFRGLCGEELRMKSSIRKFELHESKGLAIEKCHHALLVGLSIIACHIVYKTTVLSTMSPIVYMRTHEIVLNLKGLCKLGETS